MKRIRILRSHTHRCREPRGFTLVEILLVLVLIALSAAMIIPALGTRLGKWHQQRDLLRLVATVESLRNECFSLRVAGRIKAEDARVIISHEGGSLRTIPLTDSGSSGQIRFNSLGMTRGGRLRIVLNGVWEISAAPGTGKISLERGSP